MDTRTLKKIYSKLSQEDKTELKSEKVELSIMNELDEYVKELNRGIDDLSQFATDARESIAKGVRELNRLDAVYRVSQKRLKDATDAAKELGINIPEIQELERMISAYEQSRKSLTKVLK